MSGLRLLVWKVKEEELRRERYDRNLQKIKPPLPTKGAGLRTAVANYQRDGHGSYVEDKKNVTRPPLWSNDACKTLS
jgi:hypothetical protein